MHELSLAESVIEAIERSAVRDRFDRVHVVRLELGELSCVEPDALVLAFEVASRGTRAEGARLELSTAPGSGRCSRCGRVSRMREEPDLCPFCQVPLRVVAGTRMRVVDLDVE